MASLISILPFWRRPQPDSSAPVASGRVRPVFVPFATGTSFDLMFDQVIEDPEGRRPAGPTRAC